MGGWKTGEAISNRGPGVNKRKTQQNKTGSELTEDEEVNRRAKGKLEHWKKLKYKHMDHSR